jgi:hypothetical protein
VEGPEPHHSAFLVGKISDVVPTPPTPGNNESREDRFLIRFSEYALVDVPNVWVKGDRNPVKYASMEDLGIDPAKLTWEKMLEPGILPYLTGDVTDGAPVATTPTAERPLTMAEAKRGLALNFNVPPSAIEIIIRGQPLLSMSSA